MSIYCTLWNIQIAESRIDDFVEVFAQGVPGHIGRPDCGYEAGDPYAHFLPPLADEDSLRAVVILLAGDEQKDGQRYVNPLMTLSGEEYATTPFPVLLSRIQDAIRDRTGRDKQEGGDDD